MYTIRVVLILLSYAIHGQIDHEFERNFLKSSARSVCNCSRNECCSKWAYCGRSDLYCGEGCRSGPCKHSASSTDIITRKMFDCIFSTINTTLRARRFKGLTDAMFEMKWRSISKIEAAIFLAHIAHETDGLQTLVEYCNKSGTCNNYQSSWCTIKARPNKKYYGRGMFQLSYPCNYYNAGQALGLDLLNNPQLVSETDKLAASTAIWYFQETGMNMLANQGYFGATIQKLNVYECSGKPGHFMQARRIKIYHKVRKCFALPPAVNNLTC